MPRAATFVGPSRDRAAAIDSVLMTYEQRRMTHGFVFGAKGTCVELDFAQPPRLNTDDALVLDDGSLIEVTAETEPLLEGRIADPVALARACWLLGNRHVPAQILPNRIRVQRSEANEKLLTPLAAKITMIDAPFEPDREPEPHGHDHGHDHHGHDHGHDHHHGHSHEHAHDHGHGRHGHAAHDGHGHGHNHDHVHDENCGHAHGDAHGHGHAPAHGRHDHPKP